MATFEIKNYIKMICVGVNDFECVIIDEINTDSAKAIVDFIMAYGTYQNFKVLMVQMDNMDILPFDEIKDFFKELWNIDAVKYIGELKLKSDKFEMISDIKENMQQCRLQYAG